MAISAINYKLNREGRYEISFPYNLKNNFREHFKTAKWEPDGKFWHIGGTKANLNKLKAWEAAVEAQGANTFTTPSVSRSSNQGPYRYGHPKDMDIPVWNEECQCWYDAEY